MGSEMELQQVIYHIFVTQIEFGTYRLGDRLPTIEEAGQLLFVSPDTVRSAYLRLKKEGYITLSKHIGAAVAVQFNEQEINNHILSYFVLRKNAMIDLSLSMKPLFAHIQCVCLKNAGPKLLDQIESITSQQDCLASYSMIQYMLHIYGSLENDLLMRLVWQVFMFFQAPFLSVPQNIKHFEWKDSPLLHTLQLCREQNWPALRTSVEAFQDRLASVLYDFYENNIDSGELVTQTAFHWNSYKKASQLCYTLGMEILTDINRGRYTPGSFLPSLEKMAKEKQVSVSTIRRTLSLLNSIGVTKSVNGHGTKILHKNEISENCDLTQPAVRRRLSDYAQSLQILFLFFCEVSKITVASLDQEARLQFIKRLTLLRRLQRYELAVYGILELITHFAPLQTIRVVYGELFRQLLWGYPLRSIKEENEESKKSCLVSLDHFLECLSRSDWEGFSAKLEELLQSELAFTAEQLTAMGIRSSHPFI